MDRFTAMGLFVRIVETGSFSAVAREMNMTQPTVSKQLTALEKQLKTRLLNRSTRQLSLTEAGSAYFESSKRILDTVNEAEANLGVLQTQLTGVLRINSSIGLGQMYLGPLVLKFQALHPGLMIDLAFADRFVDLVEEGVDVAIRIGRLVDSNLAARRIGTSERCIIATPAYLKKTERRKRHKTSWTTTASSTRICPPATNGFSTARTAKSVSGSRAPCARTTARRSGPRSWPISASRRVPSG